MTLSRDLKMPLMALFAICMLVSIVDALFDREAAGLRLICGVAIALCVLRLLVVVLG